MDAASNEKSKLQHIVDTQEVSPADVDRMNAERDQLSRHIEDLSEKNQQLDVMRQCLSSEETYLRKENF